MQKFYILLEDDWELKGNGLGNVAELQYLPSLFLMNLCKKLNIKMTFMVDVAQQLRFIDYQKNPEVRLQKELWDNTVRLMKQDGFDVQLHLHPQWINASYKSGFFFVNKDWNIGNYDDAKQKKIIQKSIKYLKDLLNDIEADYTINSFKPGSWGMQPSENLFNNLANNGIKLVVGIKNNLYIPNLGINYKNLEETIYPYYPDFKDITKVSNKRTNITLLPLLNYSPNLINLSKYFLHILKRKLANNFFDKSIFKESVPDEIKKLKPLNRTKFSYNLLNPYETHLKIGNQPFDYLKKSFDETIKKLKRLEINNIPILIESHTKDYIGNYNNIEKLLIYIMNNYSEQVEFITLSEFVKGIEENKFVVKYNHEQ